MECCLGAKGTDGEAAAPSGGHHEYFDPFLMSSMLKSGIATAAAAGISVALATSIFRRRLLERHGVATTLSKYLRMRYALSGGWNTILPLADFDRTITTATCGTSCHGVVESCKELSVEYRKNTKQLFAKYFPIELDPVMPITEKIPLMQDWYRQAHELLLKEPLTPALLDATAASSKAALRPGFDEFYARCLGHGAPLVVCSAGLGNVVKALLQHRLESPAAVSSIGSLPIVSNWLTFDGKDHVNGFSQPLLHMFNKNGTFIREQIGATRWKELSAGRSVCLLLGDGLGDASMADGLGLTSVVKIGFLNETDPIRVAERLPQYEAAFDAVILHDRSFAFILSLLD